MIRDEYDKSLGVGVFWDNWECFNQNKDYNVCEDRGVLGSQNIPHHINKENNSLYWYVQVKNNTQYCL